MELNLSFILGNYPGNLPENSAGNAQFWRIKMVPGLCVGAT